MAEEQTSQIETTFQEYLKTKKPQEVYIQSGNDIYIVRFSQALNNNWQILNTMTQVGRQLVRKESINGPFKETKEYEWVLLDPRDISQEIQAFDRDL